MTPTPPDLAQALGFDADDLAHNRTGQLSEQQRSRLERGWRRTMTIGIGVLFLVTLLATFFLFIGQRNQTPVLSIVGVALTVANALTVGILVRSRLRLNTDLREPVRADEAPVQRTLRVAGRRALYLIKTSGNEHAVSKDAFNAFTEGARYRLYSTAASGDLLSAEKLG